MNTHMLITTVAGVAVWTMSIGLASAAPAPESPRIGEVRTFAVTPGNAEAVAALHHDGWLEANGQLLPVRQFQTLYREIGRTWTAAGVAEDRFAVPQLRDTTQPRRFWDNPYGVLSAADLVTSGRAGPSTTRSNPLSYWIFAGQDASRAGGRGN